MKLLIFTLICTIVFISSEKTHKSKSKKTEKPVCEGVHVNGKLHKKHILMNGINRPYQLAIHHPEHQVFFSYNNGEDTDDSFGIAYVKLNDTMPTEIHGVKNGFALAISEHNHKIFFGGSDGIYEANLTKFKANSSLKHVVKDKNIWDIFYKDDFLFFIDYPDQQLYRYSIKEDIVFLHEHVKLKIYQFAVDEHEDIFVTTADGLFEMKAGTLIAIPYTGPKVFRAIELNHKGVVHFAARDGIYVAHKENYTLIQIAKIKNIFGLAFDADDNIIYSNPHEIVKLLPHDCK